MLHGGVRPRVIVMEVNVKFSPTTYFALLPSADVAFNSQARRHWYGCSLSFQTELLMAPFGYELARVEYNNAHYARSDLLRAARKAGQLEKRSASEWDRVGYFDRPERKRKFRFNEPILSWREDADRAAAVLSTLASRPLCTHA